MKRLIAILYLSIINSNLFALESKMNETDEYILESIKTLVWAGFDSQEDIQQMISDILEEDANEKMLWKSVEPEFQKKLEVKGIFIL